MPTVVFDFDKTLTRRDTVLGFLLMASEKGLIPFRRVIFLFFAVLHKLKLIGNDRLKKMGIALFLKNMNEGVIKRKAMEYSAGILLSSVYQTEFVSKYPDAVIVTASYEDYVRPLCKNNLLLAAKLGYTNEKVSGLLQNAYGPQKVELLKEQGIERVDIFYTDSFSDQAVMDISAVVYLVKNGNIEKIKG
jgi:phosphoserine phosphatase